MTPREIERYRDGELTETEYESTGYALVRASRFAMSLGMSTLVAFGALEYFGGVMSAPATRPTVTIAAGGGGTYTNYALEFFGSTAPDSGRVNFTRSDQDSTGLVEPPMNFGGNFTIEGWMFVGDENVTGASPSCNASGSGWTDSNIWLDGDRNSGGTDNDYGSSLGGGIVQFGLADGTNSYTVCARTDLRDSTWHHVRIVRSTDTIAIYVDGARDTIVDTNVTGSVAFVQGTTGSPDDHLITLGAEHHDLVDRDYTGWIDEFRLSTVARNAVTATSFTVPTSGWESDNSTALLAHFDEGSGVTAFNDEGVPAYSHTTGGTVATRRYFWPSNGTIVGDATTGPVYVISDRNTNPTPTIYCDQDWSGSLGGNQRGSPYAVLDSMNGETCLSAFDDGAPGASDTVFSVRTVSGSGLDFKTTNYLQMTPRFEINTGGRFHIMLNGNGAADASGTAHPSLPTLAIGDTLVTCWTEQYTSNYAAIETLIHGEEPEAQAVGQNTYSFTATDSISPGLKLSPAGRHTTDGTFASSQAWNLMGAETPTDNSHPLRTGVTYDIQRAYIRTVGDSLDMRQRVYDVDGRLLFNSTDVEGATTAGVNDNWDNVRFAGIQGNADVFSLDLRRWRIMGVNGIASFSEANDDLVFHNISRVQLADSWCQRVGA